MSYFRRFRVWTNDGPNATQRQVLVVLVVVFTILTILLVGVMQLWRENRERVQDVKNAVIQSCRDSNKVRSEIRFIIQEIKNVPYADPSIEAVIKRYDRLTKAQAALVDERCEPLRTGPTLPGNR